MRAQLRRIAQAASARARVRRAAMFVDLIGPRQGDRILDLGSEDGRHIATIVAPGSDVTIADISEEALARGAQCFGFATLLLAEDGRVPAEDGAFDIVFSSSTIEHVTVGKRELDAVAGGAEFRRRSLRHQQEFADEIRRVGRSYFVQTPNKHFLVESHTWLPGVIVLLPRPLLIRLIRFTNRFWVKTTQPDWNLLTRRDMRRLFPDAQIVAERALGMTKSWIAVRVAPRGD